MAQASETESNNSWFDANQFTADVTYVNGELSTTSDVDYVTFYDLPTGEGVRFRAEVHLLLGDSMLGWFDDNGSLIRYDDDSGGNLGAAITDDIPSWGFLDFAITSYNDFEFDGGGNYTGSWFLTLGITFDGTNGDDDFSGSDYSELYHGRNGNDMLWGEGGDDTINGNDGFDWLNGGAGNDALYGGDDEDFLEGGGDDDYIDGGAGNDELYGDTGHDEVHGGSGHDFIDDLHAVGESGSDFFYGGSGNDTLNGRSNFDEIFGEAGNDNLLGGTGNDWLDGGTGPDVIRGQSGSDQIWGVEGADILIGGSGNDFFYINSAAHSAAGAANRDVIRAGDGASAFQAAGNATGDLIVLSDIDANTATSVDNAFVFGGTGRGRLSVVNSGTDTIVRGNIDGDPDFELQIEIEDGAVLASAYRAADFML
jgi:Ca2+-binding RTX toxin-like protein